MPTLKVRMSVHLLLQALEMIEDKTAQVVGTNPDGTMDIQVKDQIEVPMDIVEFLIDLLRISPVSDEDRFMQAELRSLPIKEV